VRNGNLVRINPIREFAQSFRRLSPATAASQPAAAVGG
jgi:hypothetical protein